MFDLAAQRDLLRAHVGHRGAQVVDQRIGHAQRVGTAGLHEEAQVGQRVVEKVRLHLRLQQPQFALGGHARQPLLRGLCLGQLQRHRVLLLAHLRDEFRDAEQQQRNKQTC